MEFLSVIKNEIPDWAKDIRLNLDGTIARSSLSAADAVGVALAAAYAAKSTFLIEQFKSGLSEEDVNGVLTAAALMGMNNVYYPYTEMAGDDQLRTLPAKLRMNAYATHGGVDKARFEIFGLAASIVGKCHFCVKSHYDNAKAAGLTIEQLQDVGRIASVVNAAAQVLAAQGK
ncbi:carboxymuconolactone decarboxylase family protein [Pelistega suis]|uniref:Alkyl hydroperoxide reductase AhpD n=1 Tax=Pelistega suis TaxID=1631957 RepID=A0A849P5K2_9BURK|nr:carboxymuconolactone decarboxylase family protein [Pelistega suis]MCQ9328975.1 carboxymuconolactone decarboxylase family protein [Pelistega suis]NOL51062.1 carboxymuconolactone decarboxylase family protein [Pelistega suis]